MIEHKDTEIRRALQLKCEAQEVAAEVPDPVRIALFSGSRAIDQSRWRHSKATSLVKLLALAAGHRRHREDVMNLLWPELIAGAAANNLRQALHWARHALEPTQGASRRHDSHMVL
jgi:DNA-binding SARP family transcriptional activator